MFRFSKNGLKGNNTVGVKWLDGLASVLGIRPLVIPQSDEASGGEEFRSWNEKRATAIGKAIREDGRVGGWFDACLIHTEYSYSYKLRATWPAPEETR